MFTQSAELYDAIYSFKDYGAEAATLATLVRAAVPGARSVLDVACGTGEHVRRLAADHGFVADGLDLDARLLEVARRKHPGGRFFEADMAGFALGQRYDAVLCLFSAIGYLITLDRVRLAFRSFREHLAPGGVVIVEPWFPPGVLQPGHEARNTAETDGLRIERISRTEVTGRVSYLHFDYRIDGPDGMRSFSEVHELGLFTHEELAEAFHSEGLTAERDPVGLMDRGLWMARPAT